MAPQADDPSSTEFPLDSPNWIPTSEAHRALYGLTGNLHLARRYLYEALRDEQDGVPSMRRCVAYNIQNEIRDGEVVGSRRVLRGPDELLRAEHWNEHFPSFGSDGSARVWWEGPLLPASGVRRSASVGDYAYFVWRPALAKRWPSAFPPLDRPESRATPAPQRRPQAVSQEPNGWQAKRALRFLRKQYPPVGKTPRKKTYKDLRAEFAADPEVIEENKLRTRRDPSQEVMSACRNYLGYIDD